MHAKQSSKINKWRYVLFLFKNFLLGPQYATHTDAQIELKLRSFSYDGERRGFYFHKFVSLHKVQHIIYNGLMEYGYSIVDDNSKVRMIINCINTNALDACKEAILAITDMQGDFDIAARHFIDFIAMIPYLQKNSTNKVSYATRSGGGRGGGRRSDRGSGMPAESDVQADMGAITSKYFRGSERDYVPMAKYNKISKAQKQSVCRLCQ